MSIEELFEEHGSRQNTWKYLFTYSDGKLYWKNPRANRVKVGDLTGQFNARYWSCNVCNRRVYLHKIIYEMHFGDITCEVDHIDRDTNNNRIENLRAASRLLNVLNTGMRSDNSSGYRGVHETASCKWIAQINERGRRKHLGTFGTPEEASEAYEHAFNNMLSKAEYA